MSCRRAAFLARDESRTNGPQHFVDGPHWPRDKPRDCCALQRQMWGSSTPHINPRRSPSRRPFCLGDHIRGNDHLRVLQETRAKPVENHHSVTLMGNENSRQRSPIQRGDTARGRRGFTMTSAMNLADGRLFQLAGKQCGGRLGSSPKQLCWRRFLRA